MKKQKFRNKLLLLAMLVTLAVFWLVPNNAFALSSIRITELMFDPIGSGGAGNDKEFIEIYNGSDRSVNLSGWSMFGVDFIFPSGSTLPAYSYGFIVKVPGVYSGRIFGQYAGKLSGTTGGETVQIRNASGAIISQVTYSFGGAWPTSPENGGPSLSLIRTSANENLAACWAASSNTGGTPGYANITSSSSASCSNVGYPTTAPVSQPATGTGGAPSASSATQVEQKKIQEAKKVAAKKAEEKKLEEAEKQALVEAEKIASEITVKEEESRSRLKLLVATIVAISLGAVIGLIVFRKLQWKNRTNWVMSRKKKK